MQNAEGPSLPHHRLQRALANLPEVCPTGTKAYDLAQALRMGIERRMTKETPDGGCDFAFVFGNVHENETVSGMTQHRVPEVLIARKERRSLEPMQDGNDVFVGDAVPGDVRPDLSDGDPPFTQSPDFDFRDVFVDDEHAV